MSQDAYKTSGTSKPVLSIPSCLSDPILNFKIPTKSNELCPNPHNTSTSHPDSAKLYENKNNNNNHAKEKKNSINLSVNRGQTQSFQLGLKNQITSICKESSEQVKSKIPERNKNFYKENFKNYKKNIQTKFQTNFNKNPKNESGYFQALHSMRVTNDKPLAIHMTNSSLQNNNCQSVMSNNLNNNYKTETSINNSQNNNFNRYWSYYNNTSGSSLGPNKTKESMVSSYYNRNNSQNLNETKIHATFSHRNYTETGKDLNSKINLSIINKDDSVFKKGLLNKSGKIVNLNTDGNNERYERPKSNNTKKLSLLINSQIHSNNKGGIGGSTKYAKEKSMVRKNQSLYSYNHNFNAINLKNNNIGLGNSSLSTNKNSAAATTLNKKNQFLNIKNKLVTKSIDENNIKYNSEIVLQDRYNNYNNYVSTQNHNILASEQSYTQFSTDYVGDFYKNPYKRSGSLLENKYIKKNLLYQASQKSFYKNHTKKNSYLNPNHNLLEQFYDPDKKLRKMKSMDNVTLNSLLDQEKEIVPGNLKIIKNISNILNCPKDNLKQKYDNTVKLKQYIKNNKSLSLVMTKEKYKELIKDVHKSSLEKKIEENNLNIVSENKNISNCSINIPQEKDSHSNLAENKNNSVENFHNKIPTPEKETIVHQNKILTNFDINNYNIPIKTENADLGQNVVLKNKNKLKNSKNLSYANPKLLLAAKSKNKEISLHMLKALIQDNCKKNTKVSKEKNIIKDSNYESRNQILNDKPTHTFDDDFDEFNSIVKQIKFENINVNKENIFSQNNFLYEAFDEKFKNLFSHVMLPEFLNKLSGKSEGGNVTSKGPSSGTSSKKTACSSNKKRHTDGLLSYDSEKEKINLFNVHLSKLNNFK